MKTKDKNSEKTPKRPNTETQTNTTKENKKGRTEHTHCPKHHKHHKLQLNLCSCITSILPSSLHPNQTLSSALPFPSLHTTLPVLHTQPPRPRHPTPTTMQTSEKRPAAEGGTKPFAIRVCSAGGTILPLHEALGNIKNLATGTINLSPGYDSYTRRLLLPLPTEYDMAHHDDLSADEAYELPTPRDAKVCSSSLLVAT